MKQYDRDNMTTYWDHPITFMIKKKVSWLMIMDALNFTAQSLNISLGSVHQSKVQKSLLLLSSISFVKMLKVA